MVRGKIHDPYVLTFLSGTSWFQIKFPLCVCAR